MVTLAGIYHFYSPFTLGSADKTLGLGALVQAIARVIRGKTLTSGERIATGLGLTRTELLRMLVNGPEHLIGLLQRDLTETLSVPALAPTIRYALVNTIVGLLLEYNLVPDRPTLDEYSAGASFTVKTKAEWVASKAGGNSAQIALYAQQWNEHDANVLDSLLGVLQANPAAPLAVLVPAVTQIKKFFDDIDRTTFPDLAALTPAPAADELERDRPDVPQQIWPLAKSEQPAAYRTYPRMEFLLRGKLAMTLANDPLTFEVVGGNNNEIRVTLRVKKLGLDDAPQIKLVGFFAAKGVILRVPTGYIPLTGGDLDLTDVKIGLTLKPEVPTAPAHVDESLDLTSKGLRWVAQDVSSSFNLDLEIPKVVNALRDIAQAIDALVLPGDVVPSKAALKQLLTDEARDAVRSALSARLMGWINDFLTSDAGAVLPHCRPLLQTIRWEPLPSPSGTHSEQAYECVLGDGIALVRWSSDYAPHLAMEEIPLFKPHGNLVRGDEGTAALAVRLDYIEAVFLKAMKRAVIAAFHPGLSLGTPGDGPKVRLRPANAAETPPTPKALRLEVSDWTFWAGTQSVKIAATTWVVPDFASARGQALYKALGDNVTTVRAWVENENDVSVDALRKLFSEVPFVPCIRLNLAVDGASFDEAVQLTVIPSAGAPANSQELVRSAFRALLPFPFTVGLTKSAGRPAPYTEWAASKTWISFRWEPGSTN